ncbi:HAMP domain-containing sensor histidine kinase [Archangium sp.]|uniref:sensor histidine kinase n=1 Tax=Archangium sp. TaxID=1872627 RepID=UPI002EDAC384
MSFLDNLGEYLKMVVHSPGRLMAPEPLSGGIDPAWARDVFIRALERLEQSIQDVRVAPTGRPILEELFEVWQRNDAVVLFAERMDRLLRESIGRDASDEDIKAWIALSIARRVGLDDALPSKVRTLEIDRLARIARGEAMDTRARIDVAAYAASIRATRGVEAALSVTPIGRVFLELTGRDAIRWLLHVEAAQSFGPSDPWRVSREAAQVLTSQSNWSFDWGKEKSFRLVWQSLKRLEALGLVLIEEDAQHKRTHLTTLPLGEELLTEIAEQQESPMSVLAGSLLADLTLSAADVATHWGTGTTVEVQASAVAEATARHSRMVAHEIRNMLVPVKTALGALYREVLLVEQPGEVIARRREGIDRGIDAVFRFVGELVELAKVSALPFESFDLVPAIRDAVSAVESEAGRRIEQMLPASLPPVSGHRARVVMALTNVLRNAAQAVPPESPVIRIQAEALEGASAVRIFVEDNGPGVPEPLRRAIFDEGISLRGGSGLGLALVREVFEKEMRGLVACDASPLGGARFVMRIPTTGMERP